MKVPRIFRPCPKCGKKGVYYYAFADGTYSVYRCKYCGYKIEVGSLEEKALYVPGEKIV